jgi:hypothetical protein
MVKDKYVRSTNLNLVTFLYANDQQIIGINPVNGNQKEFVLIKTDYLEEMIDLYKWGDKDDERLLVSVHKYEMARKELMDRLKND